MISLTTPDQIERYRLTVILSAIRMYLKTGMKANRLYTPENMKGAVAKYTGKTYARSRKGLESAASDLAEILA